MRRYMTFLTAAVLLFSAADFAAPVSISAAAAEESVSGYKLKYTIDNGEITVTGAEGSGNILDIPEKIDGFSVAEISDNFMAGASELTVVTLPNSLVRIGKRAFSACPKLSNVYIGSSVRDIDDYAFSACPALKRMSVSSENTVFRSENGSLYMDDTLVLYAGDEKAELDADTRIIGKRAFFGKTTLNSVKIPEKTEAIGDYAFSGCLALEAVSIPDSVKSIGSSCFLSCTALESVSLSKMLKTIPDDCFNGCVSLRTVRLPDSLTVIGDGAFYSCESLENLYIPSSVVNIGEKAVGRKFNIRTNSEENIADFVIYGEHGSSAETYASSLGIAFKEEKPVIIGDVNGDNIIDAKDASMTLTEYALTSVGKPETFSAVQKIAADFNSDAIVDAKDASAILTYYAKSSVMQS